MGIVEWTAKFSIPDVALAPGPAKVGCIVNQPTLDVDLSDLIGAARKIRIYLYDVVPSLDGSCLDMVTSGDGGTTFDNAPGCYRWMFVEPYDDATVLYKASSVSHANLTFQYRVSTKIGNAPGEGGAFTVTLHNPAGALFKPIEHTGIHAFTDGLPVGYAGFGLRYSTAPINAVRFFAANNNNSGAPLGNLSARYAVYVD